MNNWVIVAIPEKDDAVWKISSEKIPHMTILSLGEHDVGPDTAKVQSYLEHATSTVLHRFGMSVDRRGPLGPKDADVVFFNKSWCSEELKVFRDSLLKDPTILEWYNGSPQFPDWNPHLTLGYPESPAHPDDRDYPGIHYVNFDKIAFWVDDYDGPEIELKSDTGLEVAHMAEPRDRALAILAARQGTEPEDVLHVGVKGMKWGVRKDSDIPGVSAKVSAAAKKDAEEFTRAKLFYGTGAGNRRKLINAKVTEKSKNPEYKKAFDHHVANTNLAKRATQAKSERRRKDVTASTAKTARGVKNIIVGNPQATTIAALGIVAGAKALQDKGIPQKAAAALSKLAQDRRNRQAVNDLLNGMGIRHDDFAIDNFDLDEFLAHYGLYIIDGSEVVHMAELRDQALAVISSKTGVDVDDILHHGIKGMKWGVRNGDSGGSGGSGGGSSSSRVGKAAGAVYNYGRDVNYINKSSSMSTVLATCLTARKPIKADIAAIKSKPAYSGVHMKTAPKSLQKAYRDEVGQAVSNRMNEAFQKYMPKDSPSGKYSVNWGASRSPWLSPMQIVHNKKNVSHAIDISDIPIKAKLTYDDDGFIVDVELIPQDPLGHDGLGLGEDELNHIFSDGETFSKFLDDNDLELYHHGVKGQKWGVRRKRGPGGLVEKSDDHKEATAIRQKINKNGGTHSVSNAELRKLNERLNLETNYMRLTSEKSALDKTHNKIKAALNIGKTVNEAIKFANSDAGKLLTSKLRN